MAARFYTGALGTHLFTSVASERSQRHWWQGPQQPQVHKDSRGRLCRGHFYIHFLLCSSPQPENRAPSRKAHSSHPGRTQRPSEGSSGR